MAETVLHLSDEACVEHCPYPDAGDVLWGQRTRFLIDAYLKKQLCLCVHVRADKGLLGLKYRHLRLVFSYHRPSHSRQLGATVALEKPFCAQGFSTVRLYGLDDVNTLRPLRCWPEVPTLDGVVEMGLVGANGEANLLSRFLVLGPAPSALKADGFVHEAIKSGAQLIQHLSDAARDRDGEPLHLLDAECDCPVSLFAQAHRMKVVLRQTIPDIRSGFTVHPCSL